MDEHVFKMPTWELQWTSVSGAAQPLCDLPPSGLEEGALVTDLS